MLAESVVEAARRRLATVMQDRADAFAEESGRIISTAAAHGMINSPDTHQQVAGIVWQEYCMRAVLCADALLALVDESDPPSASAVGEQLKALTTEVLDLSVDDLTRVHRGFSGLPGAAENMITLERCRDEATKEAAARIDTALEKLTVRGTAS